MMESGKYASVTELAAAEKINGSYLCRMLRLTLLAPDVVESLLAGRQLSAIELGRLLKPLSVDWEMQRRKFFQDQPGPRLPKAR
jgi:hypothetical protein